MGYTIIEGNLMEKEATVGRIFINNNVIPMRYG